MNNLKDIIALLDEIITNINKSDAQLKSDLTEINNKLKKVKTQKQAEEWALEFCRVALLIGDLFLQK